MSISLFNLKEFQKCKSVVSKKDFLLYYEFCFNACANWYGRNKKPLSRASMGGVLGRHIACWIKMYHSFLYRLVSSEIAVPEEAAKMFDNFFKDISFAQGSGCRISEQVWGGNF